MTSAYVIDSLLRLAPCIDGAAGHRDRLLLLRWSITASMSMGSPDACLALQESAREVCLGMLASHTNRGDVCVLLKAPAAREQCLLQILQNSSNPDVCDHFEDVDKKEKCLSSAAERGGGLYHGNPDRSVMCVGITNQNYRDTCFTAVAPSDPRLCEKVGEVEASPVRRECFKNAMRLLPASFQCEQFESPFGQAQCWQKRALDTFNIAHCDKIADLRERDRCLAAWWQKRAEKMRDEALCEKIRLAEERDRCLATLASQLQKNDLCLRVRDGKIADECARRIPFDKLTL
ncbi:MAG: hypothetical protein MUF51_03580, partial [Vicinamibacteria bacterium]|nr:hypothetical protein [Vicinamibacteria bacterium]